MSFPIEAANRASAVGEVTGPETITAIVAAAALRDDLPTNFHRLPVEERQRILGLTGPEQGEN